MGGNAFRATLQQSAFPRLPPRVYHSLKARIQPLLEDLYTHVGVPREAPEKMDYGDLDLIVCLPRRRHTAFIQSSPDSNANKDGLGDTKESVNVPHDIVAAAIKAKHFNSMVGNRISNFAIPILENEWAVLGQSEAQAEGEARKEASEERIFYQVDVNVCESKDEWDRRVLFHGYGDLSMILGLIAKNAGLHLSSKGLKYPDPPNPPLLLSESFEEIFDFFGWTMDEWKSGLETNLACYKWAAKSEFLDPSRFRIHGPGTQKRKPDRTMYTGFIEWAGSLPQSSNLEHGPPRTIADARGAALDFFNKHSELNERRTVQERKKLLKNVFTGINIRGWTDLGEYWLGVKKIMDRVREKLGGDDNIAKFISEEGEERLRCVVLEAQAELGVWPKSPKKL